MALTLSPIDKIRNTFTPYPENFQPNVAIGQLRQQLEQLKSQVKHSDRIDHELTELQYLEKSLKSVQNKTVWENMIRMIDRIAEQIEPMHYFYLYFSDLTNYGKLFVDTMRSFIYHLGRLQELKVTEEIVRQNWPSYVLMMRDADKVPKINDKEALQKTLLNIIATNSWCFVNDWIDSPEKNIQLKPPSNQYQIDQLHANIKELEKRIEDNQRYLAGSLEDEKKFPKDSLAYQKVLEYIEHYNTQIKKDNAKLEQKRRELEGALQTHQQFNMWQSMNRLTDLIMSKVFHTDTQFGMGLVTNTQLTNTIASGASVKEKYQKCATILQTESLYREKNLILDSNWPDLVRHFIKNVIAYWDTKNAVIQDFESPLCMTKANWLDNTSHLYIKSIRPGIQENEDKFVMYIISQFCDYCFKKQTGLTISSSEMGLGPAMTQMSMTSQQVVDDISTWTLTVPEMRTQKRFWEDKQCPDLDIALIMSRIQEYRTMFDILYKNYMEPLQLFEAKQVTNPLTYVYLPGTRTAVQLYQLKGLGYERLPDGTIIKIIEKNDHSQ